MLDSVCSHFTDLPKEGKKKPLSWFELIQKSLVNRKDSYTQSNPPYNIIILDKYLCVLQKTNRKWGFFCSCHLGLNENLTEFLTVSSQFQNIQSYEILQGNAGIDSTKQCGSNGFKCQKGTVYECKGSISSPYKLYLESLYFIIKVEVWKQSCAEKQGS